MTWPDADAVDAAWGVLHDAAPEGCASSTARLALVAAAEASAVVYRDEYDDLCDVAAAMASALRPFVAARNSSCTCPEDGHSSCPWCEAAHALNAYEDGDR
jgi:hypothetical protein